MNRQEMLLEHLAEECNEVGQRVSKALRFGLKEVQKNQPLNNAERIIEELHDLISVAYILQEEGLIGDINPTPWTIEQKRLKIEKYLAYSKELGTLTD